MRTITEVKPLDDYVLFVTFDNDEQKLYDIKPLFTKNVFKPLKDKTYFARVRKAWSGVEWADEIDICADVIYKDGTNYVK